MGHLHLDRRPRRPFHGLASSHRFHRPAFLRRTFPRSRVQERTARHNAHGDARPLFLFRPRDRRLRQRLLRQRPHHGVVSPCRLREFCPHQSRLLPLQHKISRRHHLALLPHQSPPLPPFPTRQSPHS